MKPFFRVRPCKRSFIFLMQSFGVALFIIYVVLPLTFRYTPAFQRHMLFLPYIRWPWGVNFSEPESQGLVGTRNFYLETEPGVKIGVWHTLPKSLVGELSDTEYNEALAKNYPIIIYCHGNSGSRAGAHRMELYKILQSLDYHVISFDYRGYADSTQVVMSESGVVTDAKAVHSHIRKFSRDSPVFIWGHSLGTGVATRTVSELCLERKAPTALILESPFNNVRDEIRNHPLSYFFRLLPTFDWFFTDPLKWNDLSFESDRNIANINVAILILHAEDDAVIPIHLGKKLHHAALSQRPESWPAVQMVEFDQSRGYAHKYICRAPELPSLIGDFIRNGWKEKSSSAKAGRN